MSSGVSLVLDFGKLEIGDNSFYNNNRTIFCEDRIIIGDNVLFGWNVEVPDSDNHKVIHKARSKVSDCGAITIGDHVWVVVFSHILKNSNVPNGSAIADQSLVTKLIA